MAYSYETVRLDKGMYGEAGHSFTQVLEKCDPSEQYRGTPLEHLDAFQRQLKRFDIKVKGAGSDVVAKFFATWESAVLFPEYVARAVHQGMEENDILPQMIATETRISGLDYRSLASTPTEEEKQLNLVAEGRPSRKPGCTPRKTWCSCTSGDGCWWPPTRPSSFSGWICSR